MMNSIIYLFNENVISMTDTSAVHALFADVVSVSPNQVAFSKTTVAVFVAGVLASFNQVQCGLHFLQISPPTSTQIVALVLHYLWLLRYDDFVL